MKVFFPDSALISFIPKLVKANDLCQFKVFMAANNLSEGLFKFILT